MVQMAFCDLLHTFHKQVTNVLPACFCHPTVGNFDVSPYHFQFSIAFHMFYDWNYYARPLEYM